MAGMDFKALREAELLGRGHHGPNDPRERGPGPAVTYSSHKKKQGSEMLLRHSNANLGHKRTKNFQPKLPPCYSALVRQGHKGLSR